MTNSYPSDRGLPLIGNTVEMARDPARFFLRMYRKHGPIYQVNVFGRKTIINAEDGKPHLELRRALSQGYSKRALDGSFGQMFSIVDEHVDAEWPEARDIHVLPAMQNLITEQLGQLLTGASPRDYIGDIRTMVQFMLNVLVTRQRPVWYLKSPRYRRARARAHELAGAMIGDLAAKHAENALPDNLLGQIYQMYADGNPSFRANDLPVSVLGPYIAGLDTEANTVAAAIYGICKHPEIKAAVEAEADQLFEKPLGEIEERDIRGLTLINGCVREALRLWTIAVAQLRSAAEDFEFAGHRIAKGEMLYVATSVPHFMDEFYPDPTRFDPYRMLEPRNEYTQANAWAPFGVGPHICLGQGIAETQMALNLARLFHRLDLNLISPDYAMPTKTAPTPGPSNRFRIRVKGRR